jgi:hypothetical protein
MRELSRWRPAGAILVRAILLTQITAVIVVIVTMARTENPAGSARARIVQQLIDLPGKHLVIVRYAPQRQSLFEWVYNNADIENARIVFAREIDDPASNQRLVDHFADRRIWLLRIDGLQVSLDPVR